MIFLKKFLLFIIATLLIVLGGCSKKPEYTEPNNTVVQYPNSITKENLNGYKEVNKADQDSSQEQKNIMYYANIKSKKFHLPSCTYAKKLDEYNVRLESDYEVLINDGYIPCKVCNP